MEANKALAISSQCPNSVIVSGDAVAAQGSKIFEKPRDKNEAAEFLRQFSGDHFHFVTSIAVLNTATNRMLSAAEAATLSSAAGSTVRSRDTSAKYDVLSYRGAFENDAVLLLAERSREVITSAQPCRPVD